MEYKDLFLDKACNFRKLFIKLAFSNYLLQIFQSSNFAESIKFGLHPTCLPAKFVILVMIATAQNIARERARSGFSRKSKTSFTFIDAFTDVREKKRRPGHTATFTRLPAKGLRRWKQKMVRGTWTAIVSAIMQEGQTQFVASQRIVNRLDTGYATTGACANTCTTLPDYACRDSHNSTRMRRVTAPIMQIVPSRAYNDTINFRIYLRVHATLFVNERGSRLISDRSLCKCMEILLRSMRSE